MRGNLRTSAGKLLLRGDLFVSPAAMLRALSHRDVLFDTRPDDAAAADGTAAAAPPAAPADAPAAEPDEGMPPAAAGEGEPAAEQPQPRRHRGRQ